MATRISATPLQGSDHLIHLIGNRDESLRAVGEVPQCPSDLGVGVAGVDEEDFVLTI